MHGVVVIPYLPYMESQYIFMLKSSAKDNYNTYNHYFSESQITTGELNKAGIYSYVFLILYDGGGEESLKSLRYYGCK